MSYDREEGPKTTQTAARATSTRSAAPKPKRYEGEGLGQKPTDDMLRAIFGGAVSAESAAKVYRDETEYNWSNEASVVPDPFQYRNCLLGMGPVPANPDKAAARPKNEHPGHHQRSNDDPYGWYTEDPAEEHQEQSHADERKIYWKAIAASSQSVQATHSGMGPRVTAFRHAEGDEQIRSLLYILPGDWAGDIEKLTELQDVPEKSGVTVGSLFNANNELNQTEHDKEAIKSTSHATKNGRGKTERAAADTITSDADLQGALSGVRAALESVNGRNHALKAALAEVDKLKAQGDMDTAREEIESLKQEAEGLKEAFEILTNVATAVAHAVTGNTADAIEQVGILASTIVGHLNDGKIADAEARLKSAQKSYSNAEASRVANLVDEARSDVKVALFNVGTAKGTLLNSLTARRLAYNNLGMTAAKEIKCPERSQDRISGMLASIPLVEMVVARARAIHQGASIPAYSKASGIGLAMAQFQQNPNAANFVLSAGEIWWAHHNFLAVDEKWTDRLNALLKVKKQIILPRPGDQQAK